jgi:hypothetical protein
MLGLTSNVSTLIEWNDTNKEKIAAGEIVENSEKDTQIKCIAMRIFTPPVAVAEAERSFSHL